MSSGLKCGGDDADDAKHAHEDGSSPSSNAPVGGAGAGAGAGAGTGAVLPEADDDDTGSSSGDDDYIYGCKKCGNMIELIWHSMGGLQKGHLKTCPDYECEECEKPINLHVPYCKNANPYACEFCKKHNDDHERSCSRFVCAKCGVIDNDCFCNMLSDA